MVDRYVSFSSVKKKELHISVPEELVDSFREYAKAQDLRPNELMTYVLCHIVKEDPRKFGLHPLVNVAKSDSEDSFIVTA